MIQPTTPPLDRGVLAPPIRRSARIQQKHAVKPTEIVDSQPRRKRKNPASQDAVSSNNEYDSTAPPKRMRTTQPGENECFPAIDKPTAASPSTSVNTALEIYGEPLEPVTDEVDPDEAPATAAAAAVTVEYLASRSYDSCTHIKKMPCPPEAKPHLEPTYTRDRKGRVLARYPVHFALVYAFEVEALYRHLNARRRKYRKFDMTAALHVFAQEVYAALRLDFGDGITHSKLDDKLVYTFAMSVSDCPETLPYPAARLRKFQEIIDLQKPPTVLAFRPRPHRVRRR